jgi:hypothetical protein
MTLIPELERELTQAIGRQLPGNRGRRWRRVSMIVPVAATLTGTAVALAATGVIGFGSSEPAPGIRTGSPAASPRSGFGVVLAGSAHLLSLRVQDPGSPLPWGIRVSQTSRGLGCLAAGLVLDGQLGALGSDGDFANDGLFHPFPVDVSPGPSGCAPLDGRGDLFISVSESDVPTSASALHRCPGAGTAAGAPPSELCTGIETRDIYYGLLGPDATAITYTDGSSTRTVVPQGPEGAYLIILPAAPHDLNGVSSGLLPTGPPITRITYRGGLVCSLAGASAPASSRCKTPPGYVAAPTPHPTPSQLASPITATVTHSASAAWSITIAFQAPVAINNARNEYTVKLREPGTPLSIGYAATATDLRTREDTRLTFSHLTRRGLYTGTVTFTTSTRPGQPGLTGMRVGEFRARIP